MLRSFRISSIYVRIRKTMFGFLKNPKSAEPSGNDPKDPFLNVIGTMEDGNIADRIDEYLYGEEFRKKD